MMVTIEPITPQKAMVLKDVRLRALQDTPSAFGSTYVSEVAFGDEKWCERATLQVHVGVQYIAMNDDEACGLVGGFLDREDKTRAHLVSMWVAPTHRHLGVGKKLVQSVLDWAKSQDVKTLWLFVTHNNDGAIRFYERLGFKKTGHTIPYPNDSNLFEYEMSRTV